MSTSSILLLAILSGVFLLLMGAKRKRPARTDEDADDRGMCVTDLGPEGQVRVDGKIYEARSWDDRFIDRGVPVIVVEQKKEALIVRPVAQDDIASLAPQDPL